MKIQFLFDKIRRIASKTLALFMPNSFRFKQKVRAWVSMYKLLPIRCKSSEKRVICYYRKGSPFCPGLADRLKAMVSGYIVAKHNNRAYYIYHDHGFVLEDYLIPTKVDWRISYDDISLGALSCRRLWFIKKLVKLKDSVAEYHFLSGGDIADGLSDELMETYDFHHMFHSLYDRRDMRTAVKVRAEPR